LVNGVILVIDAVVVDTVTNVRCTRPGKRFTVIAIVGVRNKSRRLITALG
jgi:hypothetical protein